MNEVFVGSEVLNSGWLTRGRLRWNYKSIYPDVYVLNDVAPSLRQHTVGAWLWSGRRGIVAGRAAAALHGALWVHRGYAHRTHRALDPPTPRDRYTRRADQR